jgi:alkanesulfonate monooxygenase SsuD/methylene tetrahydromethanopterin reductase-like flavin-dependent oxidoreductase (luciferase family)
MDGTVVAFHGAGLDFTTRPNIPVMIATNGPKMLELAGELADEVMVQGMASPTMVQERVGANRRRRRAGRP